MELSSTTYKIRLGERCGQLTLTIDKNEEGKIVGIKPRVSKPGTCTATLTDGFCYVLTKAIKTGRISPQRLVDKLAGQSCGSHVDFGDFPNLGCIDAIARVIAIECKVNVPPIETFLANRNGDKS